ncbi:response regulator [Marinoscillum pacificum]|uniref:response regulator n=1 Tax=Marinoscillum pacificum TaxID=392723 RepID=UPI002157FF54|nr:response regulator [Marinoscillum pacificum]
MRFSVLHIEENGKDARLVERVLMMHFPEVEVHHVNNLKDFIQLIENNPPDIIISDYGLANHSGEIFLKTCRIEVPDVPFIFFTNTSVGAIRSKLVSDGAKEVLNKMEAERLPEVVENALLQIHVNEEANILSSILSQISDPIIIRNNYGFITHVSDIACLQLGKSLSDLMGTRDVKVPVDFRPIKDKKGNTIGEIGHLRVGSAQMKKFEMN